MNVLILGGTSEARALARILHADSRFDIVTSLAGRVRDPLLPVGPARIGGFGGPGGLASWLRENGVDALVDATHPFASAMSSNARAAAAETGLPLIRLERRAWEPTPADRWTVAGSLDEAAEIVGPTARRVFLTIGRQGVGRFAHLTDPWFLVRSIDPPSSALPPRHEVLLARGPFTVDDETSLMRERLIEVLVTKNSGGAMTEAKLVAARSLGIPVVMIDRPPRPRASVVLDSPTEVAEWLRARL